MPSMTICWQRRNTKHTPPGTSAPDLKAQDDGYPRPLELMFPLLNGTEYLLALRARLLLHPLEEQLALQPSLPPSHCRCARITPLTEEVPHAHQDSLDEPFHGLDFADPAAPTHRRQNNSHKEADGASKASHEHKLLDYCGHTDILQAVPRQQHVQQRQYNTFNVEATGRLGKEAITFVEEVSWVIGNDPLYWEHNIFEPSPLQKLIREIVPAVAKYNFHALARNNFPLLQ
eukprot:scaffold2111_cov167-Ochromonas_danica.AAC.2